MVNEAGAVLDAGRAIFCVHLHVPHSDVERGQLPTFPLRVELERHRRAGAQSRREKVTGSACARVYCRRSAWGHLGTTTHECAEQTTPCPAPPFRARLRLPNPCRPLTTLLLASNPSDGLMDTVQKRWLCIAQFKAGGRSFSRGTVDGPSRCLLCAAA